MHIVSPLIRNFSTLTEIVKSITPFHYRSTHPIHLLRGFTSSLALQGVRESLDFSSRMIPPCRRRSVVGSGARKNMWICFGFSLSYLALCSTDLYIIFPTGNLLPLFPVKHILTSVDCIGGLLSRPRCILFFRCPVSEVASLLIRSTLTPCIFIHSTKLENIIVCLKGVGLRPKQGNFLENHPVLNGTDALDNPNLVAIKTSMSYKVILIIREAV